MARRSTSFGVAFWTLVVAVFLCAVAGSSAIVWLTSRPFLERLKVAELRATLERDSLALGAALEEPHNLLSFLGTDPEIVAYTIGDTANRDMVSARLSVTSRSDGVSAVRLHDFGGGSIAEMIWSPHHADLPDDAIDALLDEVLNGVPDGKLRALPARDGDMATFVLAAPVLNRGLVEGAVVAFVDLELTQILQGRATTVEVAPAITDAKGDRDRGDKTETIPVEGSTLQLVASVPEAQIAATGLELVQHNILAVALVLLIPFGALGLIGRALLVAPHTELERSRDRLRAQQKELKELAAVAHGAEEAIIVTDLEGRIRWVNPAFERLSGHPSDVARGQRPGDLLQGPGTADETRAAIGRALSARVSLQTEILNYSADGRPYWLLLSISPLYDESGTAYGFMSVGTDITLQREQTDALSAAKVEIERQALHDELTGLPNRRNFEMTYGNCLAAGKDVTLIRIDLDHFKYVNDTHGHDAGDSVLVEVARILKAECDANAFPVRIGGDEFVVMLCGSRIQDAENLARRLQESIRQPLAFGDVVLRVGASFGIAASDDKFVGTDNLLRAADAALYRAKDEGRNAVCTYTESLHSEVAALRRMSFEIRRGLEQDEFIPHYQPQFDAQTGALNGVEVLVRWAHPEQGLLAPARFLPVATEMSLLTKIDSALLDRAMRDARMLAKSGLVLPKMSFNITADRLMDVQTLISALAEPLEGTSIAFEILESVLLEDQAEAIDLVFDLLREFGISIEIDDFGSGHASIVSLMRMRPDVLKFDQRLIRPLPDSSRHRDLVKSLIELAHSLGVLVTAEGVETDRHSQLLSTMGVDTLQGYHLAKPMGIDDLKAFLPAVLAPGDLSTRALAI